LACQHRQPSLAGIAGSFFFSSAVLPIVCACTVLTAAMDMRVEKLEGGISE